MFQSSILVALAASLMQDLSVSQLKSVPKYSPITNFPYREASSKFQLDIWVYARRLTLPVLMLSAC